MAIPTDNNKNPNVNPFVKWAGGKRQLLHEIHKYVPQLNSRSKYVPKSFSQYCEPFLGGAALLFDLQPPDALVNDINPELINVYEQVRDNADKLIRTLKQHKREYEKTGEEYFYTVRNRDRLRSFNRLSKVSRAARLIFLNKTCYNGLFRVNSRGEFNTPYGRYKNPNIINEKTLLAVSAYLQANNISLQCTDFVELGKQIKKKAFVYADPPYHPVSGTASFTGYAKNGFTEDDQGRLRDFCERLIVDKSCYVIVSNSFTDCIRKLYSGPRFRIKKINANRNINSVAGKRGKIPEALITGS
ncbi:MAG: DNA adenine methylase [Fibrobacteria bacterium]|nr:DNA adenine methylase [Fibrobacteria bacterium]